MRICGWIYLQHSVAYKDMDSRLQKREQEVLARKAQRLEKREEKKKRRIADEKAEGEPLSEEAQAMAALMGFSSFGGGVS